MDDNTTTIPPVDGIGAMAELTAIFYKTLLRHGIGKKYATEMTCTMIAVMWGQADTEQNDYE